MLRPVAASSNTSIVVAWNSPARLARPARWSRKVDSPGNSPLVRSPSAVISLRAVRHPTSRSTVVHPIRAYRPMRRSPASSVSLPLTELAGHNPSISGSPPTARSAQRRRQHQSAWVVSSTPHATTFPTSPSPSSTAHPSAPPPGSRPSATRSASPCGLTTAGATSPSPRSSRSSSAASCSTFHPSQPINASPSPTPDATTTAGATVANRLLPGQHRSLAPRSRSMCRPTSEPASSWTGFAIRST